MSRVTSGLNSRWTSRSRWLANARYVAQPSSPDGYVLTEARKSVTRMSFVNSCDIGWRILSRQSVIDRHSQPRPTLIEIFGFHPTTCASGLLSLGPDR